MPFAERVIEKTNFLIQKNKGEWNRFSNHNIFKDWVEDHNINHNFSIKPIQETTSYCLIRNSKNAMKKNQYEIKRFNHFLKSKHYSNGDIEKLSNFIGFLVLYIFQNKSKNIKHTSSHPHSSLSCSNYKTNPVIEREKTKPILSDNPETNEEMDEEIDKKDEFFQNNTVDDWENLC